MIRTPIDAEPWGGMMAYDVVTRFELRGYTVEIHYDQGCADPREWEGSFLWVGFPHRRYTFGDEQIDPFEDVEIVCEHDVSLDDAEMCPSCAGDCVRQPRSLVEACEAIAAQRGAIHWEVVSMTDHSGQHYNLGPPRDQWDSGVCGVMLVTAEMAQAWGCVPEGDPAEWWRQQMAAEIDEYDRWANGDCYYFDIWDADGAHVESCGGIIGLDAAIAEATACVPDEPSTPTPPPVRISVEHYHRLRACAGMDADLERVQAEQGYVDPDVWSAHVDRLREVMAAIVADQEGADQ